MESRVIELKFYGWSMHLSPCRGMHCTQCSFSLDLIYKTFREGDPSRTSLHVLIQLSPNFSLGRAQKDSDLPCRLGDYPREY